MNDDLNTTIICVDDEEDILSAYKDILLMQKEDDIINQRRERNRRDKTSSKNTGVRKKINYAILSARSGEEAVEHVRKEIAGGKRIAVGFFDMRMPGGIDGLETIKRILCLEPDILCVVVTAYTDKNLDQLGSLFNSQDQWIYMSKPFSRFEVEQIAYNLVKSWNRRRKEEKIDREMKELNLSLQEKINLKTYNLQRRVTELNLINDIGKKINSMPDLDILLEMIIHDASEHLHALIGSILLVDDTGKELVVKIASGPQSDLVTDKKVKIDENAASGYVVLNKKPLLIHDMDKETRFKDVIQQRMACNALISVPLLVKDRAIGVMHLGREKEIFTNEELHFLVTLADQATTAIENAKLYKSINDGHLHTIQSLAAAIDAKDPYTHGHSERVTGYAVAIAHELNLPGNEIETLRQAGLLHDIGKIGISEKVLNKTGKLSHDEYEEIKKHPSIGEKIIAPLTFYPSLKKYVRHHHERFDGKGYPDELKREDIPLGARIFAVADSYDAMTSDRCYKKAFTLQVSIDELKRCSGTQFDPMVVEAFLRILEGDK